MHQVQCQADGDAVEGRVRARRLLGRASLSWEAVPGECSSQPTGKQVLLTSGSNAGSVCEVPGNWWCSHQGPRGGEGGRETGVSQTTCRSLTDEPDGYSEPPICTLMLWTM